MPISLTIREATELTEQCLRTGGYTADEAHLIADHLIDCELRDVRYGGMSRLLSILERVRDTPEPPGSIALISEMDATAAFDGGDQVGYLVAHRATVAAIDKAKRAGVSTVSARNTWMTGMFSYYIEMATRENLVAIVAGNSVHAVAPHGGTEPRFGTNPLAIGFPTEDPQRPFIWDSGTSNVMHAEVALAKRLNQDLRPGLAFDADGAPTTDPDEALAGAFTVWGGHRGSGLAMSVQILGMIAGASAAPVGAAQFGFIIVVIDPKALVPDDDFPRRVSEYAESVRRVRPEREGQPVRVAFDRSAAARARHRELDQIEIPDSVYEAVNAAATQALAPSAKPTVARWLPLGHTPAT